MSKKNFRFILFSMFVLFGLSACGGGSGGIESLRPGVRGPANVGAASTPAPTLPAAPSQAPEPTSAPALPSEPPTAANVAQPAGEFIGLYDGGIVDVLLWAATVGVPLAWAICVKRRMVRAGGLVLLSFAYLFLAVGYQLSNHYGAMGLTFCTVWSTMLSVLSYRQQGVGGVQ